jgi:hypothetical protein
MGCVLEVVDKNFLRKYSTKYSTDEKWMMVSFGYHSSEFRFHNGEVLKEDPDFGI